MDVKTIAASIIARSRVIKRERPGTTRINALYNAKGEVELKLREVMESYSRLDRRDKGRRKK